MRTVWKVLIAVAVALVVLLAVNAIVVDQQTKGAKVTAEGGQILHLPGGDVQATDTPAESSKPGAPIVLLHCYACSLHWWDQLEPLLTPDHRVIRIDMLGFGGSEKPAGGYAVEDQAQVIASALNKLGVQGAVVVGQSMGSAMAVSLAQQSSQLVDRVVDMSAAADNESGQIGFLARLAYVPVLGEALWRVTPDFAVVDNFKDAFAPGYEMSDELKDMIIDGFDAMTYTSYDEAYSALEDFRDAQPLDDRMREALVPVLAIFGEEDQIVDVNDAAAGLQDVPGIRIVTLPGVGHTPQIEAPEKTAGLIEDFARAAAPEVVGTATPKSSGGKPDYVKRKKDKPKPKQHKNGKHKNGNNSG